MPKATGPTYYVPFNRRRKGLTNYSKRLKLVKSRVPRMVVRRTLNSIIIQFFTFEDKGDKTVSSTHSSELKEFQWPSRANIPTAYLTGLLAGYKALKAGVKNAVLDLGLQTPTKDSVVFAALKGAIDAGVKVPSGLKEFDEKRLKGEHIAKLAALLKGKPEYEKQFSAYVKAGVDPQKIPEMFDTVKSSVSSKYGG